MKELQPTTEQREKLRDCHPGSGLLMYNAGGGEIAWQPVFLNRQRELCNTKTGEPIQVTISEEL